MKEFDKTPPFCIYLGAKLYEFAPAWLEQQYPQVQEFVSLDTGVVVPDLEMILHRGLAADAYLLLVHDEVAGCGSLGLAILEDFYPEMLDKIERAMRRRAHDFLSLRGVQQRIRRCDSFLVDLVLKETGWVQLRWFLMELARERVSIRNLDRLLELLLEQMMHTREPEQLLAALRTRLAGTICRPLERLERLTVVGLSESLQQKVVEGGSLTGSYEKLDKALSILRIDELPEVLVVPAAARRRLRLETEMRYPDLHVLCPSEVRRGLAVTEVAQLD